jgi:hypothetical protein
VDALVHPILDYGDVVYFSRVVATEKGFREHTITVSDSSLAFDVGSIFLVSGRNWGYVRLDLCRRMRYYTFIFKPFLTIRVPDYLYFFSKVHSVHCTDIELVTLIYS